MPTLVDTNLWLWRLRVSEVLNPLLAFEDSQLWQALPRRAREEFVLVALEALPRYMEARGAGWPAHACGGVFRCGGINPADAVSSAGSPSER